MDAPTRNDILASRLLYAALGLLLLFQIAGWISQALALPHNYFSPVHFNRLTLAGVGLTALVRGGLAYAVRRGVWAAKLWLALGFVVACRMATYWDKHLIADGRYGRFAIEPLVLLLTHLLTLAALVLMFWSARDSAPIV